MVTLFPDDCLVLQIRQNSVDVVEVFGLTGAVWGGHPNATILKAANVGRHLRRSGLVDLGGQRDTRRRRHRQDLVLGGPGRGASVAPSRDEPQAWNFTTVRPV